MEDLNPVQKQVARVTNELCRLLDSTRPLSGPIRLDILKRAYLSLNKYRTNAERIAKSGSQEKRKLTKELMKRKAGKDKSDVTRLQYL